MNPKRTTENMNTIGSPCGGECASCEAQEPASSVAALIGWRLALAASGTFLFPLMMAIAGAAIVGDRSEIHQCLGTLVGLSLGVVLAAIAARTLRPAERDAA